MSLRLLRSPDAPKITSANRSRTRNGSVGVSVVAPRLTCTPALTRVGSAMSSSSARAARAEDLLREAARQRRRRGAAGRRRARDVCVRALLTPLARARPPVVLGFRLFVRALVAAARPVRRAPGALARARLLARAGAAARPAAVPRR